ncbi:hypothetical protein [Thermoflexibacter ruber]|uniref:Uncharacterized protein n=1 Tax=Thermoflexibacter ruber TaxID=1003 RepID=A0A1I2CA14_9BACT|nr:hypothetical protein [Thermoflexibacter ruber]SFE65058.1 hypothetical protein SAMN04488541_1004162 [Thermoflexibacter ruber]
MNTKTLSVILKNDVLQALLLIFYRLLMRITRLDAEYLNVGQY